MDFNQPFEEPGSRSRGVRIGQLWGVASRVHWVLLAILAMLLLNNYFRPTPLEHPFVDWLVDAIGLVGDAPIDVVVNRAPSSPVARQELISQLRQITGERIDHVVITRFDRRVERASWDATVALRGPFVRAVAEIAAGTVDRVTSGSEEAA